MSRKYFGTDGVRGVANRAPMSPDMVMKIGLAAGIVGEAGQGITYPQAHEAS